MAYIACPSCSAEFFSKVDVGDFVCPTCSHYFQLDEEAAENSSPREFEGQAHSKDNVSFVRSFDKWAEDEAEWMANNKLEPDLLEANEDLPTIVRDSVPSQVSFCVRHGRVEIVRDVSGRRRCKQCVESDKNPIAMPSERNKPLQPRDNLAHRTPPRAKSPESKMTSEIDNEPIIFKFILPMGTVAVIVQYVFEPLHSVLFFFIFYIWGLLSIIGIAIGLGMGGDDQVRFGPLSTLSLLIFSLMVFFAILSGIFSGGNGSSLYDDCIEVGRYGEVQCY